MSNDTEIFDLKVVDNELNNSEVQYNDMDDIYYQTYYLGSCFNIVHSGKYYMPFACSNVTEDEAHKDKAWYELAESELNTIDAFLESGEGDPTDMFISRVVDKPVGDDE